MQNAKNPLSPFITVGSLWPFKRQKLLAVYEKSNVKSPLKPGLRGFAFVLSALWNWHPLGPPRGFYFLFFVRMAYLRYQHDAWEHKFSSLNLRLMFSNLMRQNSAGPRVLKPTHCTKKLMSARIIIFTFSRVSKHESIPHLSVSWLKYSTWNVYVRLFCHPQTKAFAFEQSPCRVFKCILIFADRPPRTSVEIWLWAPPALTAESVAARDLVIFHRAAAQRLLQAAHCIHLPTCSRIVPPFLRLQSFQIVPAWIVSSSAVAPIACIVTAWKTGWKRSVIADEGQTLLHYVRYSHRNKYFSPHSNFPWSAYMLPEPFAFPREIWVETCLQS